MPRKKNNQSENYNKAFPKNLREIMNNSGATQTELADYLGKSRQAISYYCDGSSSPDWETLVKIADYFNVSANWLLGLPGPKSLDADVAKIMQCTGLSENSISFLKTVNDVRIAFNEYLRLNRENQESSEAKQASQYLYNSISKLRFLDNFCDDARALWDYACICSYFEPVLVDALLSAIQNSYKIIVDFSDLCRADLAQWKHEDQLLSFDDYIRFKSGEIAKAIDRYLVDRFKDKSECVIYYDHITEEYRSAD